MNHWSKILIAFKDGEFFNYYFGLTPRFIIGVCQNPIGNKFVSKELAYRTTKQMFTEMQQYNSEGLIVTSNSCDIHKGPVMKLVEREWSKDAICTSFDIIWGRYGEEITNGEYQINRTERKLVQQVFKL